MGIKDRISELWKDGKFDLYPRPRVIKIETTDRCNHKCIFCANKDVKQHSQSRLNKSLVYKLLLEAHEMGVEECGFYMRGEPLLTEDLPDYISLAKKIGIKHTFLNTNGELATANKMAPILQAGIDSIRFSINGGDKDTYKEIHGKDCFHRVIMNLQQLKKMILLSESTTKLSVSFVQLKQNVHTIESLKELIGHCVDEFVVLPLGNSAGNVPANEEEKRVQVTAPCPIVFNTMHVTSSGHLSACCIDYNETLIIADLTKESLKEAWHNETFTRLRAMHLSKILNGTQCYNCVNNTTEKVYPLNGSC